MSRTPEKTERSRLSSDGNKLGREVLGLASIFLGLLVILSLATFDGRDPWLNHVVSGAVQVRNKAGLFGAYLAGLLYDIVGAGAWAAPAFFCLAGMRRILGKESWPWWRWTGFALMGLSLCLAGAAVDLGHVALLTREALPAGSGNISSHGGGIVGHMIYTGLVGWMGPVGAFLVWFFSLALALQMLTGISLPEVLLGLGASIRDFVRQELDRRSLRRSMAAARPTFDVDPLPVERLPLADAGRLLPENDIREEAPGREGPPEPRETPAPIPSPDWGEAREAPHGALQTPSLFPDTQPLSPQATPAERIFGSFPETTATGRIDLPEAPRREALDDLVHPLVPRPENQPENQPGSQQENQPGHQQVPPFLQGYPQDMGPGLPPDIFGPAEAASATDALPLADDEDMPPWVREFEMGRVGVPPLAQSGPVAASVPAAPEPAAFEAPGPFVVPDAGGPEGPALPATASLSPVFPVPPVPEAAPERRPASEAAFAARPVLDDEDLYSAVWGPQEQPSSDASAFSDDANDSLAPQEPDPAPHVSARTAAALEALRAAAASGPDPSLRPGPDALTLDSLIPDVPVREAAGANVTETAAAETEMAGEGALSRERSVSERSGLEGHAPEEHGPEAASLPDMVAGPSWAAQAFEDDIPIFEAPPVEQAEGPGLVRRLAEAVVRPRVIPLPGLELLQPVAGQSGGTPREALEEKGRSLMTCLKDFGVQGELVGITPGPVVTMFEVRPAPGVRVSRISNLSDDLALALKAVAVRIQAPVPGTDTVGIEIPNEVRETVCLRELLGSTAFSRSPSLLTLALGKDIAGHPAVADLATMPHLLVAGATGAGKSVGINSIILSFLYKARPEEVQLLLVDPKRVEMAIYADLPHLVHPVVTEMQLAKNALEWAVAEMERRYDCIARAGVRNIADYNAKIAAFDGKAPEGMADLEFIPYLVLIIDELADLMLVAAKEVENSIVRLAQLARAAGIHLILATQRPSVDVVTGLIKANFPCRISFQVTSKHDSRTILDTVGAEHLLGRGDMLFKPAGGKSVRMHGAFVSDKDVNAVVGYWKSQQPPRYRVDFADWAPESSGGVFSGGGNGNGAVSADPLYNEAVEFVRQQGKASISLIQRKFRIGFNKAARYIEQMEVDGIIGPADGSKPRNVIG